MVRNQAKPRHLEVDGYHCKVSYYGQAKECDICEKTGHIAKDCPFRGKCLRCGQAGHLYRDCRNEPVAATTPGPRELPVDPEDNRSGEAMESDSLVNRTVPPVHFVPASIVSSDGFIPIRRRAKRKRAGIFESSYIGNVDNCLVNDNNGDTASSENGEAVDIVIYDVNIDSQASKSSVANHSTASMNDNSRPFSLSIQPLTAFSILSYGKRDFAEAEGRKTEIEERCMRRRRVGGRGKKFNAGPEGRNLAKETENQRGFA